MRHEREFTPKKSVVVRFTSLYDPMCGTCRNKETFTLDLLDNTHAGKKRWGLVFYGVKYNILAFWGHHSPPFAPLF